MMKTTLAVVFSLAAATTVAVEASTKVAVLEFGNKPPTVRRVSGSNTETTVNGILSFWNALHDNDNKKQKLQHSGMSMVPDLFSKPDSGVVIGLMGGKSVDLEEALPNLFEDNNDAVVGHMEIPGGSQVFNHLLANMEYEELDDAKQLHQSTVNQAKKGGLTAVKTVLDTKEHAEAADKQLASLFSDLKKLAEQSEQKIVVHLVVEEDPSIAQRRRRQMSGQHGRRLEDEEQDQDGEDGEGEEDENVQDDKEYNGYYGYGYYNDYGEWITPYKTMFQIQYFNVVTWTAIGLFFALVFTIYLMAYMPLEADTLLFGESAKLVGDE